MKRLLLLACLAALALGFALGFSTAPAGVKTTPAAAPQVSPPAQKVSGELALQLGNFSHDERITRVFSSLQQRVTLLRKYELAEALRGLTARDMAGLVKHVQSLSRRTSSQILPALVERWFELDPAAAAEWAKTQEKETGYETMRTWARADPESAIRFALSSDKEWRSQLMFVDSLDALHGKDFAAKLSRVLALPTGDLRDYALNSVLANWAAQDPAAAFAAFEKSPPRSGQDEMRGQLLRSAAERDPAWAIAKMEEILPSLKAGVLGHQLVGSLASAIAGKDPRKALDWLASLPEEFRTAPAIGIGREWALKEPVAALEWCMEQGVDITRADWSSPRNWQPSVLGGVMEKAPQETFARLAALPPGAQRDRLLECAFMESLWHTPGKQLYADNDAMARTFYKALPEESQVAKAWLFGQKRAEFGVVEDVAAWSREFPSGLARSNAIAGVMSATRDPARVEEMLGKFSAGPDRDAALRGLAVSQSAPAGVERALNITDTVVRRDTLESIVPRWLTTDSPAARAWVQKATIPEEWKQEWLRQNEP
jgi:hypothetical protein